MKPKTVREIAVDLLIRIEKEGGFSHLLISEAINRNQMDPRDETLLTELVYGTTERKMTLDYYLEPFLKKGKKLDSWVRMLLRMSVYQFVYLDKVPVFAVINESVNIAKQKGHRGIASFVNGVLRSIDRNGLRDIQDIKDPVKKLSIETSHPEWLLERWISQYGQKVTEEICRESLKRQPFTVRVNSLKTNRETILQKLQEMNLKAAPSPYVTEAVSIEKGSIFKTDLIDSGMLSVQDLSSMIAAKSVDVEADMKVIDACSAPGGKAAYLAEMMNNSGEIHAFDLHHNKIKLIKKNAERLGIENIDAKALDARKLQSIYDDEAFDRVLIDAPCSGFGVIRSKPDIKYQKTEQDIMQLQEVQQAILDHVAPLVKHGGKMVYSTCTIEKEENEWQIQSFLERYPTFVVDDDFMNEMKQMEIGRLTNYGVQLFPQSLHSDGFFITRLLKLPV